MIWTGWLANTRFDTESCTLSIVVNSVESFSVVTMHKPPSVYAYWPEGEHCDGGRHER